MNNLIKIKKIIILNIINKINYKEKLFEKMGIGDWGLGIGDWGLAQSPIPNPQSPIPNPHIIFINIKI